jgi:RimJ/RimL family protein N-acetyltransferase
MSQTLTTPRLRLTYEPDVETFGGDLDSRCGVYYLSHANYPLGALSLTHISRECGEIGYEIEDDWRGQGFASEAVAAVVAASSADHGFTMLIAQAWAENFASRRVLEKNGFVMVSAKLCWSQPDNSPITIVKYRRVFRNSVNRLTSINL